MFGMFTVQVNHFWVHLETNIQLILSQAFNYFRFAPAPKNIISTFWLYLILVISPTTANAWKSLLVSSLSSSNQISSSSAVDRCPMVYVHYP
jgi:hypothetical protein